MLLHSQTTGCPAMAWVLVWKAGRREKKKASGGKNAGNDERKRPKATN